ncbi:MAG: hypothetical protein JXQ29_14445 [Planctomycetes bacterium]|nr:hypothetical protein [Planctomycetota bacterium]
MGSLVLFRSFRLGLLLALAATTLAAQYPVFTSSLRAFHAGVGPRVIVRDKAGDLYTLYRDQLSLPLTEWRVGIARSSDGGKTWNLKWQTGFDSNPAGHYGNVPGSLAIDSQENLHVTWNHQVTNYQNCSIVYNRYDRVTQSWGTEVQIVPDGYGRTTSALAIDSKDYVWMLHSTTSSWRCIMSRSDKPLASDLKFTPTTPTFMVTANCQHASLVVDALDRIHASFYSTGNGDTVHHQWLDPNALSPTWTVTPLGNVNLSDDEFSSMAADLQGNVYIVYGNDTQRSTTGDPNWELRKWDGMTTTWSAPVPVYKTTHAQFRPTGGDSWGYVICLACDEGSGEVYFTYRNFESGQFLLARWHDGDPAPTTYALLANTGTLPPNALNYMWLPNFRGSLFPVFNRTALGLHLIYCTGDQTASSPSYTFWSESFPVAALTSPGAPKIGTTYPLALAAVTEGRQNYAMALTTSGNTPVVAVGRRFLPIVPDSVFYLTLSNVLPAVFGNFQGALDPSGSAQASVAIPNLGVLVGVDVHGAFVTFDPSGIRAISNPWFFRITA